MSTTTIRIRKTAHRRLRTLARHSGRTMQSEVERLIDAEHSRRRAADSAPRPLGPSSPGRDSVSSDNGIRHSSLVLPSAVVGNERVDDEGAAGGAADEADQGNDRASG